MRTPRTALSAIARAAAVALIACASSGSPQEAIDLWIPPQPTNLAVVHRSGQSFVTWTERAEMARERYRVYRSDQPIDAASLAQATLLGEVAEGSSNFFADRYQKEKPLWLPRYVQRFVIEDDGPELDPDTGLLVWTLDPQDFGGGGSGDAWYAVTVVTAGGFENWMDFSAANSIGPLAEAIGDPAPVRIGTFGAGLARVYIQYLDLRRFNPTFHAPNPTNMFYGLSPLAHGVPGSLQYAYTYSVVEPDPALWPPPAGGRWPVLLVLHVNGHNRYPPDIGPTKHAAVEVRPVDVTETWWFGFARDTDFRKSEVAAGDTIVNYTEQRVLRMLFDALRDPVLGPGLDTERIYVSGHSMGASGALAFALRFPGVFAAAYASKPLTDYKSTGTAGGFDWRPEVAVKWGQPALNLPVEIGAPSGWADHLFAYAGMGVWDWQDHLAQVQIRQGDEMVPLGFAHGIDDTVIEWPTQGQPAYGAFDAGRRAWGGAVLANGHAYGNLLGLPPSLAAGPSGMPFADLAVVRSESVPGLSSASSNPPLPPSGPGSYNANIEWSSSWSPWDGPPLDTPQAWQVSLRTLDGSTESVDVTPRRLQAFLVEPGRTYRWENRRVLDSVLVSSGNVQPDSHGLVTVGAVEVTASGNRLGIVPALPDPVLSTATAAPAAIQANGIDVSVITIVVLDPGGTPLPGQQVVLSASGNGNLIGQPGLTDASGTAKGTLAATQPGTKKLTVTVNPGPGQVVLSTQPSVHVSP
jgi:hypothetical protein